MAPSLRPGRDRRLRGGGGVTSSKEPRCVALVLGDALDLHRHGFYRAFQAPKGGGVARLTAAPLKPRNFGTGE